MNNASYIYMKFKQSVLRMRFGSATTAVLCTSGVCNAASENSLFVRWRRYDASVITWHWCAWCDVKFTRMRPQRVTLSHTHVDNFNSYRQLNVIGRKTSTAARISLQTLVKYFSIGCELSWKMNPTLNQNDGNMCSKLQTSLIGINQKELSNWN